MYSGRHTRHSSWQVQCVCIHDRNSKDSLSIAYMEDLNNDDPLQISTCCSLFSSDGPLKCPIDDEVFEQNEVSYTSGDI